MALSEQRTLKSVEILPVAGAANVCWANQVFRDGELIAETLERRAYVAEDRAAFLADVDNADVYLLALGWPEA